jgi:hypothetical protein
MPLAPKIMNIGKASRYCRPIFVLARLHIVPQGAFSLAVLTHHQPMFFLQNGL